MSLKSSTFANAARPMPVTTELNMVRGGFDGPNRPLKKRTATSRDAEQEPEITGSHELSNAVHNEIQYPAVSGSGERHHTLLDRPRTSKGAQLNITRARTSNGSEAVPQKIIILPRRHRSTVTKDLPSSDSEELDDRRPTFERDVSKSNRKQDARGSSHRELGNSSFEADDKPFDFYSREEHSATSDASDASDSLSDASESDPESEESSSDPDSDGDESNAHSDWFDNESKTSISATIQKPSTLAPKRMVYFRIHPSMSPESASKIKQQLEAYLPDAVVLLESMSLTTPYSDREVLNNLLSELVDGQIREILVADSNHICATKDGFNVFAWMCHKLGAKVFILPALQSV